MSTYDSYDSADLLLLHKDFNSLTDSEKRTVLSLPVEALDPSVRSYNCLKNNDIEHVGELIQHTPIDMLHLKNFGLKSLREVRELLASSGLQLGYKIDPKTMLPCGPIEASDGSVIRGRKVVPYDLSKFSSRPEEICGELRACIEANLTGSRPAASAHEAYAWVSSELLHLWGQICSDHPDKREMKNRAMRAAVLLVRFCLDICQE